jgi:YVTN family beta-propeller protein
MKFQRILFLTAVLFFAAFSLYGQPKPGYHLLQKVTVGGEGGWDYLTMDSTAHRLYVSRGSHVQVFDTQAKKVVGDILNTAGVHGIALDKETGRGYTSNGRDSSVSVVDLKTLQTVAVIKVGARNPDAILYDKFSQRLFTFNGGSSNATVIDVKNDSVIGHIALGGKPEFAVTDGQGTIFVNIEDKSMVAAFDALKMTVTAQWPLGKGEEPSGLAIDREHHRLFSVCSNKLMVVLDSRTGKIVSEVPIGSGTDAAAFDPVTGLAFSSNGEGTVTVVKENNAHTYEAVETVTTQKGSRTMTLDESTHLLYLASVNYGPAPAPTADRPKPRPAMEPGSFSILIFQR